MISPKLRAVALCVIRRPSDGRYLVFHDRDEHDIADPAFCRPLGGEIEFQERSDDAARREMFEELGIPPASLSLLGILENAFTFAGIPRHEIVFVYHAEPADPTLYQRDQIEFCDGGDRVFIATWHALDEFRSAEKPTGLHLVPKGLFDILRRTDPAPTAAHSSASFHIRPATPADLPWIRAELHRHWHGATIWSLGIPHRADALPAFLALSSSDQPLGLVTYVIEPRDGQLVCEIITLSSNAEDRGIGTALLNAAVHAGRDAGCQRITLTTSNDNLRALRFYQRRGWVITRVLPGIVEHARRHKPSLPAVGMNGIPLRDEIELELPLPPSPAHPPSPESRP